MSIIPDPQLWAVDPDHLRKLRRRHAEQAFAGSEFDRALAEAEELLSSTPDDAEALWITARAALHIGDACMSESALRQLLNFPESNRPASEAVLLSHLSLAVFLQADFTSASNLAQQAIRLDDSSAMAWLHLALAVERLGQPANARVAYMQASKRAPNGVPPDGDDPPQAVWDHVLAAAIMHLSDDEQAVLSPLAVSWEWFPPAELLRSVQPPISPFIEAIVSGSRPPAAAPQPGEDDLLQLVPSAQKLTLYRGNLLRGAPETAELVDRLVLSLRSEIAAWIGVPVEDLMEPG